MKFRKMELISYRSRTLNIDSGIHMDPAAPEAFHYRLNIALGFRWSIVGPTQILHNPFRVNITKLIYITFILSNYTWRHNGFCLMSIITQGSAVKKMTWTHFSYKGVISQQQSMFTFDLNLKMLLHPEYFSHQKMLHVEFYHDSIDFLYSFSMLVTPCMRFFETVVR